MQKTILKGTLQVPGDKSISHRALIFSLLSKGRCRVTRLSPAADCRSTISCLRALGVPIEQDDDHAHIGENAFRIDSPGLQGLQAPQNVLDAGNSGTTIRLLSGILAGQDFSATLDGDESLRKRPMSRVLKHLSTMGARVNYKVNQNYPPFEIIGSKLRGQEFDLDVASAQVQTAILLAGLQSDGKTSVKLPAPVRDHTERMFEYAKVPFERDGLRLTVSRLEQPVKPFKIDVPGDISSAAFFMVAAAMLPGSELMLSDVGLNPGRTLVLEALQEMGANARVIDKRMDGGEPVGTIVIKGTSARLKGITIGGDRIAAGIDEIPILALAGAACEGTFSVRDAAELRIKESDRLGLITSNLETAGAEVKAYEDGFDVIGTDRLKGGNEWKTDGDHRLAMMGMIANVVCSNAVKIDNQDCVAVSYPQFASDLAKLLA